jgi:hypothetical protein
MHCQHVGASLARAFKVFGPPVESRTCHPFGEVVAENAADTQGFSVVTARDITALARVGRAMPRYYFHDDTELFEELRGP